MENKHIIKPEILLNFTGTEDQLNNSQWSQLQAKLSQANYKETRIYEHFSRMAGIYTSGNQGTDYILWATRDVDSHSDNFNLICINFRKDLNQCLGYAFRYFNFHESDYNYYFNLWKDFLANPENRR